MSAPIYQTGVPWGCVNSDRNGYHVCDSSCNEANIEANAREDALNDFDSDHDAQGMEDSGIKQ